MTVKKIANCNNIDSVNPLYLMIYEMIGHFEEKNESKYLVLDGADESKEVSKKYKEVWDGIQKDIETINGGERVEYGKIFKNLGPSLMMICWWINYKTTLIYNNY